jgi:hypothetical protein
MVFPTAIRCSLRASLSQYKPESRRGGSIACPRAWPGPRSLSSSDVAVHGERSQQPLGGVVLEGIGAADIVAHGLDRFMSRHVHHGEEAGAGFGRRGQRHDVDVIVRPRKTAPWLICAALSQPGARRSDRGAAF